MRKYHKKSAYYVAEFTTLRGLPKHESMEGLRNQIKSGLGCGTIYKITPKGRKLRVSNI